MARPKFFFQPSSRLPIVSTPLVFIFITSTIILIHNCQFINGSTAPNPDSSQSHKRVSRQLGNGFGGFGTSLLASLQPQQPYNRRQPQQPSSENSFFHSMMNLNFDMTEVFAMYRNVTAVAQTPGCLGHCRTPMALWVVQSFYPCYSLKKADCPRGLVCCMPDPSQQIASPNTIHDSRVKGPSLASSIRDRGHGQYYPYPLSSNEDSSAQPSSSSSTKSSPAKPTSSGHTESTTLFDEEYFKNNFIQDEIPEIESLEDDDEDVRDSSGKLTTTEDLVGF